MKKIFSFICAILISNLFIISWAQEIKIAQYKMVKLEKKLGEQKLKLEEQKSLVEKLEKEINGLKLKSQPPKYWTINGTHNLLFNQTAFIDWFAGGDDATSFTVRLNYNFDYKKDKHNWNNNLILGYGSQNQSEISSRKTEDIIDLKSRYGYRVNKHWLLSLGFSFLSQFAQGFDYGTSEIDPISKFLAPGYLSFGPGIDYKPRDNFWVSISPGSSKLTVVADERLSKQGAFGVYPGDHFRYDLGVLLSAYYLLHPMKNISIENNISLFSNYLKETDHIDIKFTSLINLKVNDYISAQLTLDLLYDHDILRNTQVKETFAVGLNYRFDR